MDTVIGALYNANSIDTVLIEQLDNSFNTRQTYTRGEIAAAVNSLGFTFADRGLNSGHRVGLVASNTAEWIVADLALLVHKLEEVPVPLTFSAEQAASMLANVDACLVDQAGEAKLRSWGLNTATTIIDISPALAMSDCRHKKQIPQNSPKHETIIKTIHTSGTTGLPKGVQIRRHGLQALLTSLVSAIPKSAYQRYLSLVPFSLLIEQVVAIYLPLLHGGRVVLLPPTVPLLGTAGSRASDAVTWLQMIKPSATVLTPAAVSALEKAVTSEDDRRRILGENTPFFMAGGAPVDPKTLMRLDSLGIPVYEGYGLSENSSVVSWNRPGKVRYGSAGLPLDHCRVMIADSGELLVKSTSLFAGYSVEDPTSKPIDRHGWLHTGDIARIDDEGFVYILGRVKNIIITANGRNIAPEWVEGRLRSCHTVNDCTIFGNQLEHVVAIALHDRTVDPQEVIDEITDYATQHLAETDRPDKIIPINDTRGIRERYFTVTGRPRRDQLFRDIIEPTVA